MKRVRRILAHKRHWLWHAFTLLVGAAGMGQQLFDPRSSPVPYLALCLLSLGGGFVAWWCKPADCDD